MDDGRHQELADHERQAHGPGRQRVAVAGDDQHDEARDEIPGAGEGHRARQRADGGEHAERDQDLPEPRQHPQRLRREFPQHHREQHAGNAGRQELLDRLVDHGIRKTGMMPPRPRQHLDPDHGGGERRGRRPAEQESQWIRRGLRQQEMLQDGGDQRDAAGGGDGRRAIAAERGAGRKLAADGDDVGQRPVEIAHLFGPHAPVAPARPFTLRYKVYRTARQMQGTPRTRGRPLPVAFPRRMYVECGRLTWGGLGMRRALLVSCLLQAAIVSIAQAAGPFGTINVGGWKGGAYSNDNTGEFSHCAAASTFGSGISLIVGHNARDAWLLSFASPNFRLNKGQTVPIDVVFDGQEQAKLFATANNNNMVTAILPPNVARSFQKASLMVAVAGRTTMQFNLTSTGPLIAVLANCVSKVKEKGLDASAATEFSAPKQVAAKDASGGPAKPGKTGNTSGTGFVIDATGHIITNHHVIDGC